MRREKLNDEDRKVLVRMTEDWAFPFRHLARETGLTVDRVRLICRRLKRMGYAYHGTCWNEDDNQPSGSGYFLSVAGEEEKQEILNAKT